MGNKEESKIEKTYTQARIYRGLIQDKKAIRLFSILSLWIIHTIIKPGLKQGPFFPGGASFFQGEEDGNHARNFFRLYLTLVLLQYRAY